MPLLQKGVYDKMKTLKFRIWDKVEERYDSNHHIRIDLEGNVFNLQTGAGGNEYVIEQFTGLLDKSGVKIYEGDVCHNKDIGTNNTLEIVFRNGMFSFGFYSIDLQWFINQPVFEIIGNVHQNPDLLETK